MRSYMNAEWKLNLCIEMIDRCCYRRCAALAVNCGWRLNYNFGIDLHKAVFYLLLQEAELHVFVEFSDATIYMYRQHDVLKLH